MKLQIDFDKKVLSLESNVNLKELFDRMKKLFPNGEWKEFTLEANTQIVWSSPIYIEKHYDWLKPWWQIQPTIYGSSDPGKLNFGDQPGGVSISNSAELTLNSATLPDKGVYQVEM